MKKLLAFVVLIATLFVIESCSTVGYGVGQAMDKRRPPVLLEGWQVAEIKHKTPVKILLNDGRVLEGRYLKPSDKLEETKAKKSISIEYKKATIQIPVDQIHQIQAEKRTAAPVIGLVVGATIDAVIFAKIISSKDSKDPPPKPRKPSYSPPPGGTQTGGDYGSIFPSCPLVYVEVDGQYKLDAEPFGGALFKSAEFTDIDRLENLAGVDDIYRLMIANHPSEKIHLNQLQLQVIDHPAKTEVLPSNSGDLTVIRERIAPKTAVSFENQNVRALLRDHDELVWLASPFDKNPEVKSELRTGVTLAFDRPMTAQHANLILNVQNTEWGVSLQDQILTMQGSELEQWYQKMNESEDLKRELIEAMVREGMLLIKVWDGIAWKDVGHIWEVGPAVDKHVVVGIDLHSIATDDLKIKIEGPPGVWVVNQMAVDYSDPVQFDQTVVQPATAVNREGVDIRHLIEKIDENYVILEDIEDFIDLTYVVPSERDGWERTVILRSTGYYKVKIEASGEPQTELFNRMMKEPYLFMQHALRALHGQVTHMPL
ncbi:MAG: hypothetical protein OEM26_09845 [Saprospiraceae bacterium]|nr:hypothetical protein [Saprospiraceae bacterium]